MYFDEFMVGEKFESKPRTVSQENIQKFAELTGDLNKLHIDAEYAKQTIFGGRIAHGLFTLSLSLGLWYDLNISNDSVIAFLGFTEVSFRSPVRPGNSLRLISEVLSKRKSKTQKNAGIVTFKDRVLNETGTVVLEGQRTFLISTKPIS